MTRLFLLLIVILLLGPLLAPHDPLLQQRELANLAPTAQHWLGTDDYGRDVASRFLAGASWSILVGAAATALVLAIAWLIGGAAGFLGGWVDQLAMRLADLFLVLPWFYLLLGLRSLLPLSLPPRPAFALLLLTIALVSWARPARLVRGLVLTAKEAGYVHAARGFGVPAPVIFFRHVLPATFDLLATQALILLPRFILAEVSLSFLGLGLGEPDPSWGALLVPLKQAWMLDQQWWRLLPALCMMPVFIGFAALARQWGGSSARSTLR